MQIVRNNDCHFSFGKIHVTAQAAPLPPNRGGKSIRLPQDRGQGGTPGAIETILTAWLSSYARLQYD